MAGTELGAGAPARSSRGPRSRAGEAGAGGCGAAPARQRAAVGARPCGDEPSAVPLPLPAPGAAAINGRGRASLESRGLFIFY